MTSMDDQEQNPFVAGMMSVPESARAAMTQLADDANRALTDHAATLTPTTVSSITISIEFSNGTGVELEANHPTNVEYDVERPLPDVVSNDAARIVPRQPPPVLTFRFKPDADLGYAEHTYAPGQPRNHG
jgi:hypothetical protein